MRGCFFKLFLVVFMGINFVWSQQPESSFTFNPLEVKRDPFSPPELTSKNEITNDLVKFDLFEVKLVAVMTGLGAPKAMVVLPNKATHIVQVGDRIGKNSGHITSIKMDHLVVLESFKDFRGRIKKNYETLRLQKTP